MTIPLIGNIIDRIKYRGASTGLNQTRNSFKMAGYLLAPFVVGLIVSKTFIPPQYEDVGTLGLLCFWIIGIVLYYSNAKSKAASYLPFPQSHWFFPDGQQISYDLMVTGWEQLVEYDDGSRLVRVFFKSSCAYQETDRPYPDIFNHALWKIPTNFNDSFKRNAEGEFFFDGLFISHPACENIQVTVIKWDERGSYRLPECVVTGCSYWAQKAIANKGKTLNDEETKKYMTDLEASEGIVAELKAKNIEITTRNSYLEKEHEEFVSKEPTTIKGLSDDRIVRIQKMYGNIMYAKKSAWTKILNLKTFAVIFFLLAVFAAASHVITGWP